MAKITCYGGAGSATGANFLLELEGNISASVGVKRVLVDCGMEQGAGATEHNRREFAYDPSTIDILLVTHAHIDHIGLIPKLVKRGFKGEIYSTPETKDIAELLLADAVKIQDEDPIYTLDDVSKSLSIWQTLKYRQKKSFGTFSIEFLNAGHVLGSAFIRLTTERGTIVFTGDIGNSPSLLLEDREVVTKADYLLMESVYGDRNHLGREERVKRFEAVVQESIKRGGVLLIPAFSLERTQELLTLLDDMFEKRRLPSAPVYLDSPLALRITPIFERVLGGDKFKFQELVKIVRVADSHEIWQTEGPKIIIAGSGMGTAGRILSHEARYLPDPNNTILFMGYQASGTLGRQIEEGVKKVLIDEREVVVRARVVKIEGFSGHADSDALVDFVSKSASSLKKVFVAMGEPKSQIFLAQRLRDELGVNAVATEEGKSYQVEI